MARLKLLLDTHIWLWSLHDEKRLGRRVLRELGDAGKGILRVLVAQPADEIITHIAVNTGLFTFGQILIDWNWVWNNVNVVVNINNAPCPPVEPAIKPPTKPVAPVMRKREAMKLNSLD